MNIRTLKYIIGLIFCTLLLCTTPSFSKDIKIEIGHTSKITAVAISNDGKLALSGSQDKTVKLWDLSSGKSIQTFYPKALPLSIAFSPDNKFFATESKNYNISLWSISKRKPLKVFKGHTAPISTISFSGGGQFLVSGSQDQSAKIWDLKSGVNIRSLKAPGTIHSIFLESDGQHIQLASTSNNTIWNIATGVSKATFTSNPKWEKAIYSPDGLYLLSTNSDQSLTLWNTKKKTAIKTIQKDEAKIWGAPLAFSPNNQLLATVSNKHIKIWNISNNQLIMILKGHHFPIETLVFSQDSRLLVSGSGSYNQSAMVLWDLTSRKALHRFQSLESSLTIMSLTFSPEKDYLAIGMNDGSIHLLKISEGQIIEAFQAHTQNTIALKFSADGKSLFSGGSKGNIKQWSIPDGKLLNSFYGHTNRINSLDISSDGKFLISGSHDQTARYWSINQAKLLKTFRHNKQIVFTVFNPLNNHILTVTQNHRLKVWDIATSKILKEYQSELLKRITSITLSKDKQWLLLGNKSLALWHLPSGKVAQINTRYPSPIVTLAFSDNHEIFYAGSWGSTLKWSLKSKRVLDSFSGQTPSPQRLALSQDSYLMASGNKQLNLWNLSNGKLVYTIIIEPDKQFLTRTPDDHFIASPQSQKKYIHQVEKLQISPLGHVNYENSLEVIKSRLKIDVIREK